MPDVHCSLLQLYQLAVVYNLSLRQGTSKVGGPCPHCAPQT